MSVPPTATAALSAEAALDTLSHAIQDLSLATSAEEVQRIVRRAARVLVDAGGATFVLRDADRCFYVDEEAIEPLWKGQRFPLDRCISGWSMLNREQVVIEDIYADDRIPHEAYRPTFVKSLVMTPIRRADPIGAIGMYWADHHVPTIREIGLAQALADSTAVALQHVATLDELDRERRSGDRDAVTGVLNRHGWEAALAAHDDQPGVLARIEIERRAGDDELGKIVHAWSVCLQPSDLLARLGDDEFAVYLADPMAQAERIAERLRFAASPWADVSIEIARD